MPAPTRHYLDFERPIADLEAKIDELSNLSRTAGAKDFDGEERVIPRALTLGVAPILAARSILVLAFGPHKAEPVAQALTGPMTSACTAAPTTTTSVRPILERRRKTYLSQS